LRERQLKPHLVQRFQFSNDKHFDEKLDDVVGLYLNPPENAVVFCVDEKTQRLSPGKNTAYTAVM